jgi:hypothetical protein
MGFSCTGIEARFEAVEEVRAGERRDGADADGFAAKAVDGIEGGVVEDETEVIDGAAGPAFP